MVHLMEVLVVSQMEDPTAHQTVEEMEDLMVHLMEVLVASQMEDPMVHQTMDEMEVLMVHLMAAMEDFLQNQTVLVMEETVDHMDHQTIKTKVLMEAEMDPMVDHMEDKIADQMEVLHQDIQVVLVMEGMEDLVVNQTAMVIMEVHPNGN